MTEFTNYIELVLKNNDLRNAFNSIIRSVEGFEIISPGGNRIPDLLIIEIDEAEFDSKNLETILNKNPGLNVFLTAQAIEPEILLQAMRLGIKDFFPQPLDQKLVSGALDRIKRQKQESVVTKPQKNGQILSIFGSKGGVGTTTVAVNLAVSLSQQDSPKSVALLDMNTLFGEIPLFLEISPQFHWGEITKNIDRLDNTFLMNILSVHSSGIHILPSPAYLNGHVRPTPEIMVNLLSLMKEMFDFVIVDAGQSTGDTSLKVLEISDKLLLITILSLPCLANTSKLMKSLIDLGYIVDDRIKVILNRHMKNSEITLQDAEAGLNKELFWIIPNDYGTTMSAINKGKPLSKISANAPITRNFQDLANTLIAPEDKKQKKKWRLFKR